MQSLASQNRDLASKIEQLPNTKFKTIYKQYAYLGFRPELIWDIYSTSNEVTWDNLIAYELCLNKGLPHEWPKLFKRDYPEAGIYDRTTKDLLPGDYKKIYLSQPDVLKNTTIEGLQDIRIIDAFGACSNNPEAARKQALDYRAERQQALKDVNSWAFRHFRDVIKSDRYVVLAAVKQDGNALQHASDALKNDREIVLAAVKQDGNALQHASDALRNDREIVLAAVKQEGYALKHAGAALKNDREIVLAAVKQDGYALQHAGAALKNDSEIVLAASKEKAQRDWLSFNLTV